MAVETRALGGRSLARRAGLLLAIPALTLALALGGCRGAAAHNTNSNTPGVQSGGSTSSSGGTSTSGGNNPALQQLQNADNQNQTDQQQLNGAASNAGQDYSSQDTPLNP